LAPSTRLDAPQPSLRVPRNPANALSPASAEDRENVLAGGQEAY
jgi:hypothetical protein